MKRKLNMLAVAGLLLPLAFQVSLAAADPSVNSLDHISTAADGSDADGTAYASAMTPDGRYVAYVSGADNILPNVSGVQVYFYDTQQHTTSLISQASDGSASSQPCQWAVSVSNDGRYVLFGSAATNLAGNNNGAKHLYLRDRRLGVTTQIDTGSLTTEYIIPHAMSGDGNSIIYQGDQSVYPQSGHINAAGATADPMYIYNRITGQTISLSTGTRDAAVSNDGRYVTYSGLLANPAPQSQSRAEFMYDLSNGTTTEVSGALDAESTGSVLSLDDTHIAYFNYDGSSPGTFSLYTEDLNTQTSHQVPGISTQPGVSPWDSLSISANNRLVTATESFSSADVEEVVVDAVNGDKLRLNPTSAFYKSYDVQISPDGTLAVVDAMNADSRGQLYLAHIDFSTRLAAPTNLQAASPTNRPVLTWSAPVWSPNHYDVYRDGVRIGSTNSTNYTDISVPDEGAHTYFVVGMDANNIGGDASSGVSIVYDGTSPTVSNAAISPTTILLSGTLTISANASDILSGVAKGEYYIDTDPGQGHGTVMTYNSGTGVLSATKAIHFGSLSIGRHTMYIRAQDAAGNWSTSVFKTFTYL